MFPNRISVDGDTSVRDQVIIMANGLAQTILSQKRVLTSRHLFLLYPRYV